MQGVEKLRRYYELKYSQTIFDSRSPDCPNNPDDPSWTCSTWYGCDCAACNPVRKLTYIPLPDDFDIEKMLYKSGDVWKYEYDGKMWEVVKKRLTMKDKMKFLIDN